MWSCLDDKHQQRGLRLLSKICRAHGILPTSYILQQVFIHVGPIYCDSGFAVVNRGEYLERPVAIKRLKIPKGDTDGVFKVLLLDQPPPSPSLTFHPGVMSRNNQLETFVPSEYLTFVGGLCVCRPALFAHPHRVDAQRGCYAVHKIKPRGEPLATGELTCCFLRVLSCSSTALSSLRSCLAWHTSMTSGSFMGISKAYVQCS